MSEAARYLLVLYLAEHHEPGPTPPGTVAAALDRSPAAATEMLQRLDERGLLTHEPYEGATLSRFFRDGLELPDHETEALALAGAVSPAVAERLEATLPLGATTDGTPPAFLASDGA